jgi:hypothetical protein
VLAARARLGPRRHTLEGYAFPDCRPHDDVVTTEDGESTDERDSTETIGGGPTPDGADVEESDGNDGEGSVRDDREESDGDDGVPDPSDGLADPSENVPPAEAPDVEAPSVGVDAPEVPSPEDAPADLRAEFWELVIAFNVAFFALALGAMLLGFEGKPILGGATLAVGALALGYGIHGYVTREHTP